MELLACSGPGAGAAIAENIQAGFVHAVIAFGLLLISLGTLWFAHRRFVVPLVLAVLLALHPAWTISAAIGDCGDLKHSLAILFTVIGCLALCWQVVRVIQSRQV